MLAALVSPCRNTVSNLICVSGHGAEDWSAHYRLYGKDRVEPQLMMRQVLNALHAHLPPELPLVAAIDDTLVRKSGAKIHGVGWKRDPLGPRFQTNLVRGQRYLQISAAWPLEDGQARMLPLDFTHAPSAPKPARNASPAQLQQQREQQKQQCLNQVARTRMKALRQDLPAARKLVVCGDGSYTNADILKNLPQGSTYIGRIRKDAVLHALPGPRKPTGRPALYGPQLPTPEQLRCDESVPWQTIEGFAAGKRHSFKVKSLECPALWRKSGGALPLRLMVIAPVSYRLRAGARLLYRQPAYLICTDPDLPLHQMLQYYLWRWGIEVNFRDEKTLLGAGDAHVRLPASTDKQPALVVAAYSLLWLAALQLRAQGHSPAHLKPPKWRRPKDDTAVPCTNDLLRALRYELWAGQLNAHSFSHFASAAPPDTNQQKPTPSLANALFTAA